MRNIFFALFSLCFAACSGGGAGNDTGSIYGVVTVKSSAEPMRATGVELYNPDGQLLLKTVTFDDGHYEFADLGVGEYCLKVVAEGYGDVEFQVYVEAGRTARADMQLDKAETYISVRTLEITDFKGDAATFNGSWDYDLYYPAYEVGFFYSQQPNPASGGTRISAKLGRDFSVAVTGLSNGLYYVIAYAKNQWGTTLGDAHTLQISGAPSVTTLPATNFHNGGAATLNGKIDFAGDPAFTERGFVYSSSFQNPTIEDPISVTTKIAVAGTSTEFSTNIANLNTEQTYFVRAYAINNEGITYGLSKDFTPVERADYVVALSSRGIMVQKNDANIGIGWYAAIDLCENSRVLGYNDWRLPNYGELKALYDNRISIGALSGVYWADSQNYNYYVDILNFATGQWSTCQEQTTVSRGNYRVRCVRTLP